MSTKREMVFDPKGNAVIHDHYLYYADRSNHVNCVDIKNGYFLYSFRAFNNSGYHLFPDDTGVIFGHDSNTINHINDKR